MRLKISDAVKSNVIRQWLKGSPRDGIASKNGVSAGAVTNIVNEWKAGLDYPFINDIREFAVTIKNSGITVPQCASAFRLVLMLEKIGMDEENFESFVSDVYNYSMQADLPPAQIASSMRQLVELVQSVPLSQTEEYVQKKKAEKQKLETEIKESSDQLYIAKCDLEKTRNENEVLSADLKSISTLKAELQKLALHFDDIPRFVKTMKSVHDLGYDAGYIADKVSNLQQLKRQNIELTENVAFLDRMRSQFQRQCQLLDYQVVSHNQTISKLEELESMGFSLKMLDKLWYMIAEISDANKISYSTAIQKFFSDIERQYKAKLGFESELQNLKSEIEKHKLVLENTGLASNNQFSVIIEQLNSIADLLVEGGTEAARSNMVGSTGVASTG
jgi:vacuolar-type H+-ATPase subunit I/STV1